MIPPPQRHARLLWMMLCLTAAGCVPIDVGPLPLPDARPPPSCRAATDCGGEGVAAAECVNGLCVIERCADGFADVDGAEANGCEHACPGAPGLDRCDGEDSDCDGRLDEDGDDTVDACGACDIRCAGPAATYACVEGACAIAGCDPGRYPVDGDPASGCPCAGDDLTVDRTTLAPAVVPIAARVAFPGDGSPGAVVWTAVADGVHHLWRWPLTPEGYPQGIPVEIAPLAGPRDVTDVWFTGAGELVVILSGPGDEIDPELVAYVAGERRPLGDNCDRGRCAVVALPLDGPGLIRLTTNGDRSRVVGPDGASLLDWTPAAGESAPALVRAACLDPSRCLVLLRRAGAIEVVGLVAADLSAFDELTLAVVGDRVWFAGRVAGQVVVAAVDRAGMVSEGVALAAGWDDIDLLSLGAGEALLVGDDDGAPAIWRLGADHQPIGAPRTIAGGFVPAGVAAPDVYFDQTPRGSTVERLLWSGLPRSTPDPDVPPTAVGGQVIYRGDPGVFVASLDAGPVDPRLALVRLDRPRSAPAAARIDGVPTLVESTPEGLVVVEVDESIRRRVIALERGDGPPLLPPPDLAVTPDAWLALAGALTNGRGVIGVGPIDADTLPLHATDGPPERTPRLIGPVAGTRWLATRLEPGDGYETKLRPITPDGTPGPAIALARRLARDAGIASDGERIYVAWLDRRSPRCAGGPTDGRLVVLDGTGQTVSDAPIALGDACPLTLDAAPAPGGGAYIVLTLEDALLRLTVDRRGAPVGEAVRVAARPGSPAIGDRGDVVWTTPDTIEHVEFDCRLEGAR